MASNEAPKPRVGVPWRTFAEERVRKRERYDDYLDAIRDAGGEPVEVSLVLSKPRLEELAQTLDAVVLPGSPADVDPALYHAARHSRTVDPDGERERTDYALLDHAFEAGKPVLAICYGVQLLNVHRGGTLIQDIPGEVAKQVQHKRNQGESDDPWHVISVESGSRLAALAGRSDAEVNSSHHQAIREAGKGLRVVAEAPDGVIEAVEWQGDSNWVTGVQWHPERMGSAALAQALFRELVEAARKPLEKASTPRRA